MAVNNSKYPFGQPMDALEKKIINLQRSTSTSLPIFTRLHNALRMKHKWYYNWHLKPNSTKIHKAIAIVYTLGMLLTFVNFTLYYSVQKVTAASYTWDGGGTTNNWSDCNNWSTNVCPTSADTVTFNTTSTKDSVVDASFGGVVGNVGINTGYTGTVSLARSLNLTGTFTQQTGTFTASNQTFDVDSIFTLSGGTFTASSGTTYIGNTFTVSGSPTFNHNNGTVEFDTATSVALTCNNITFNLVRFTAANNQKTINTGCTLPLGNDPNVAFNIRLNGGTLSGTGTIAFASQFQHSGGSLSGFTGITVFSSFTLNGGTLDLSNYNPRTLTSSTTISAGGTLTVPDNYTFTSSFVLSGGIFNAPSGTVNFNSTFTASSGTFNANGGTVAFGGSTTATLSCTVATFNAVVFTHVNNAKTISANCNLPVGTNPTITGPINLTGTLTGTGTLTLNSTLQVNSTGVFSGFSGLVVGSTFTLAGGTMDMSSYSTVDLNGAFSLSSGTWTSPSVMSIANNVSYTSGTFNHNNGTVIFDGSAGNINCSGITFNYVQINHTSSKTIGAGCTLPLGANPNIPTSVIVNGTLSGTGTLTLQNNTLTVNSGGALSGFTGIVGVSAANLTVAGGTVDMSNYTSFDMSSFTISSGSFTAPTAGMTVRANFVASAGTFNGNGGTLTLSSGGNLTCSGATITFGTVAFTHPSSTRTVSGCTVPMGSNPSMYQTTLTNATLTGTGTLTITGSMTLNAGGALSGFTGFVGNNGFVLSGGTADFSGYSIVDFNNIVTINSGTFTAPSSGSLSFALTLTVTGGTFNANGGTVTIDGSSNATLTCNNITFNRVVLTATNTRTLNDCQFPLGANATIANSVTLNNSTLSGTGSLTSAALTFNSGGTISGFSSLTMGGVLTVSGGSATLGGLSSADINSNVILSSGTLTAPSGTMFISGTFTVTGGNFNHGNGTIVFDGSSTTLSCGNVAFNLVRLESTANTTKTINSDCTLPLGENPNTTGNITLTGTLSGSGKLSVSGILTLTNNGSQSGKLTGFTALATTNNLTIQVLTPDTTDFSNYDTVTVGSTLNMTSGTLKAPKVLNVVGNWNRTDGLFIHNNGTVNLTGRDQVIAASNTFYNLSKVRSDTAAILFVGADTTQTIVNETTLKGYTSSLRLIVLPTPATGRWKFDPQGTRTMANLDVRNTDNINAKKVNLTDTGSLNRGTTTGFVWFVPSISALGPTNLINGSTTDVTTPALTFTTADQDTGDTTSYQIQIDDSSDYSSPVLDYTSSLATPGAATYTVGQAGTYTVGSAGQKLSLGSYVWRVRAIDSNGSTSGWVTANASSPAFVVTTAEAADTASTPTPTPETGSELVELKVAILDAEGNKAAGASVTLYSEPRNATADSEGIAHFSDVPTGEHTLVVEYNGKVGERTIVVEAEPENLATVTTEPVPVELTIQLKETKPIQYYLWLIPTLVALLIIIILMVLRLVHYKKYHPGEDTQLLP